MKRLGYTRFVAQGGDWGAAVTQAMGAQAAPELLGLVEQVLQRTPDSDLTRDDLLDNITLYWLTNTGMRASFRPLRK